MSRISFSVLMLVINTICVCNHSQHFESFLCTKKGSKHLTQSDHQSFERAREVGTVMTCACYEGDATAQRASGTSWSYSLKDEAWGFGHRHLAPGTAQPLGFTSAPSCATP